MSSTYPHTVVFTSDARGLLPLTVATWSLLETTQDETGYDVYILSDGIPEEEQKDLRQHLLQAWGITGAPGESDNTPIHPQR